MSISKYILCILVVLSSMSPLWGDDLNALKFTEPVIDNGGMLSSNAKAQLGQILRTLKQSGGSQIAVVTIDSLDGNAIEAVSLQIAERWKLGTSQKDNGILLLIAKTDRKLRIEVGQGLEGDLPDAYAKRIIDQVMTPYFRSGNIDQGVLAGVVAIIAKTDPDFKSLDLSQVKAQAQSNKNKSRELNLLDIFILVFVVFGFLGVMALSLISNFGRGMHGQRSHYQRYGSGSSGFGGGGGFSGGGGGFSGGGASGGW